MQYHRVGEASAVERAIRKHGTMMVKGEGGAKQVSKGAALWEKASAKGDEAAQANLNLLRGVSFRMR